MLAGLTLLYGLQTNLDLDTCIQLDTRLGHGCITTCTVSHSPICSPAFPGLSLLHRMQQNRFLTVLAVFVAGKAPALVEDRVR